LHGVNGLVVGIFESVPGIPPINYESNNDSKNSQVAFVRVNFAGYQ